MNAAKLVYRPIGLATGALGGVLAGTIVKQVWRKASGEDDAPDALQHEYPWKEVLLSAALQGLVFAVVKAAADRGGAVLFEKLTGSWPGD